MNKAISVLRKNTMIFVLLLVYLFFTLMTEGQMFTPLNFNALIIQNAYVYILAVTSTFPSVPLSALWAPSAVSAWW